MEQSVIGRGWCPRGLSPPGNDGEPTGAVAEAFLFDAHAVEQGEVEVAHGGFARETDVTALCEGAAAAACEDNGEVIVIVAVVWTVAHDFRSVVSCTS